MGRDYIERGIAEQLRSSFPAGFSEEIVFGRRKAVISQMRGECRRVENIYIAMLDESRPQKKQEQVRTSPHKRKRRRGPRSAKKLLERHSDKSNRKWKRK